MSDKQRLSKQRSGTQLNRTSKKQEEKLGSSVKDVLNYCIEKHCVKLVYEKNLYLKDVINDLKLNYKDVDFKCNFENTSMKPDGGLLYLLDNDNNRYIVLITEIKNQGTNDSRQADGLKKQAKGNAIERLGKNVIGFRAAFSKEDIFPFVCFGDGCDFSIDSAILDRVSTVAQFGELNKSYIYKQSNFQRGSFYFREQKWSQEEMFPIMKDIAERSILHYFSKYGDIKFK